MFQNWLKPINPDLLDVLAECSYNQFGNRIKTYVDSFPDLEDIAVAIIGIDEEASDAVRNCLYRFSYHFGRVKVADLGNIRNTDPEFLLPVLEELIQNNILPIVIGSKANKLQGIYKYYQKNTDIFNLAMIGSSLRFVHNTEQSFLQKIIRNEKSCLSKLTFLGYQSHLSTFDSHEVLTKKGHQAFRLSELRDNFEQVEPLVRDADFVSFDISSIRISEAPGQIMGSPSGFFSEEACQVARYAGLSDNISSFAIFGFEQALDKNHLTATTISELIWYFIEGFSHRVNDYPQNEESIMEYNIQFKDKNIPLTFIKSNKSGRWWIKLIKDNGYEELIPCTYDDYLKACKDEIPERLFKVMNK